MATESKTRNCPYCREEIKADAVRCKHCRSAVAPEKPAHGGTCPYCKEAIHPEAIKCKHCGSSVGPAPGGQGCAEAVASPSKPCGCGGAPEAGFLAAPRRPGGTGSSDLDCALARAKCSINCWLKYPNDPLMERACTDACDAAYRLCRTFGSSGGGIFMF